MKTAILGIDPGLSGAMALIDGDSGEFIKCEEFEVIQVGSLKHIDGAQVSNFTKSMTAAGYYIEAYVERVSAMPGQGVSSMFTFGGASLGILVALGVMAIPFTLVTPPVWKKGVGIQTGAEKSESLSRARQLFPSASLERNKDHASAEALLIARYGYLQKKG
ncbi:hypothetical protein SOASR014_40420 [Pectobacterium carotovorum subsp. carotovorum]|nr:hypothetical protein SOASR014_40420 [Pectobacterium carotovorum subsp. carotovorum]GLX46424.1 hypothetical protein Pcaca01_40920 [Pectobacterium carotovorum subsp. carotovorum]